MKCDTNYQKDLVERNKETNDLMIEYASKVRDIKVGLHIKDSTQKLKLDFKGHDENE